MRFALALLAIFYGLMASAQQPRLEARLDGRSLARHEGIWQLSPDTRIAVIADEGEPAAVYAVASANLALLPGTRIGKMELVDPSQGRYRLEIQTDVDDNGRLCGRQTFDATIKDGSALSAPTMTLKPVGKIKAEIWMLWRRFVSVSVHQEHQNRVLGAERIYPASPLRTGQTLAL